MLSCLCNNDAMYLQYRRARQRCFWLLAFISRPQVRNIHLPGRMILPRSLIPSDKYFLKNLTFVVRISTRVATSPFQSNSLRGQGEEQTTKEQPLTQQEEVVMTSRPVGQEGRCSLVVCSSPWPRKEFDWNGDVATRVDMRTTKVKFFKKYLSEGMSDPGKIIRPGR